MRNRLLDPLRFANFKAKVFIWKALLKTQLRLAVLYIEQRRALSNRIGDKLCEHDALLNSVLSFGMFQNWKDPEITT